MLGEKQRKQFLKSFKIINHAVKKQKQILGGREGGRSEERGRGGTGREKGKEGKGEERVGREKERKARLSKFVRIKCKKVKSVFKSIQIFGHVIKDTEV